jgi:hypothetical protein
MDTHPLKGRGYLRKGVPSRKFGDGRQISSSCSTGSSGIMVDVFQLLSWKLGDGRLDLFQLLSRKFGTATSVSVRLVDTSPPTIT